jgi:hypothetical protein
VPAEEPEQELLVEDPEQGSPTGDRGRLTGEPERESVSRIERLGESWAAA